ncbi:MAG: mechanosensitive ion channel [Alphaproteobacteria bacterium]|nr:mechanosensitive ion channel [Alphaproteobacteria bacterium]
METLISISTTILYAVIILGAGYYAGNRVQTLIQRIKRLDNTLKTFLGGIAKYGIFILAIITVLQLFGFPTVSLLAVLGAAGLAIGLALQGTLSNISAGVMLLILRPFDVGDFISCGDVKGTVKSLGLFATELCTSENTYLFVPNGNLWNTDIENFSRNNTRRQDIVFGISYNDDINKAFKVIEKTIKSDKRIMTKDDKKKPQIMVTNLGESSIDITLRTWSKTSDVWGLKIDIIKTVKEALDKEGITIPFPTRTIEMVGGRAEAENNKKAA